MGVAVGAGVAALGEVIEPEASGASGVPVSDGIAGVGVSSGDGVGVPIPAVQPRASSEMAIRLMIPDTRCLIMRTHLPHVLAEAYNLILSETFARPRRILRKKNG